MSCLTFKAMVASMCFLALILTDASGPPTSRPGDPGEKKDSTEADPLFPSSWGLKLSSATLDRTGLREISATLQNLSRNSIRINRSVLAGQLGPAIRIWKANVDGSYRMRLRPNIWIDPSQDLIELAPGKSVTLEWRTTNVAEVVPPFFELARHDRWHALPHECTTATLEPGEYVIDAMIDISFADLARPSSGANQLDVTVPSDNKLWVSVGK